MNTKETKRIVWIDITKGIGIIIMIMGHVGFGGKFDRVIHSYHMPLFFIISGILYRKTDFSVMEKMKHKGKTLLLPYVCFFIINYVAWLILVGEHTDIVRPIYVALTYNTHDMPICGALWFLTAMFWMTTCFDVLDNLIINVKVRNFIVVLIALLIALITTFTKFRLPWSADIGLIGMGFYLTGIFVGRIICKIMLQYREKLQFLFIGILFLLINCIASFLNGYVNMKEGWFSIIPLTWINAVIGTIGIIICAIYIDVHAKICRKVLSEIGNASIVYLGLNQVVIELLKKEIPVIGNSGSVNSMNLLGSVSVLISVVMIIYLSNIVLFKTKFILICGK